ncbi:hypothetical protein J6590_016058 [Homalodisca vitripennis]|nr:hypothetical protein J6590_016058 [Homalodisca vitripennis]
MKVDVTLELRCHIEKGSALGCCSAVSSVVRQVRSTQSEIMHLSETLKRDLIAKYQDAFETSYFVGPKGTTNIFQHVIDTGLLIFKSPEGQVARWIERLQEYDFGSVHRARTSHRASMFFPEDVMKDVNTAHHGGKTNLTRSSIKVTEHQDFVGTAGLDIVKDKAVLKRALENAEGNERN